MAQSCANLLEQDKQIIAPLYGKADINFVKGEGSYLYDDQGNKYLDFVAGIAVNALGHQNQAIKDAVVEQMNHFNHISNLYPNYPQINLGKALLEITKFDKAFFCNSGTEANEGAIKFARKYFDRKGEKNRQKIITFVNSFHGRTYAALSATGQPAIREGFGSMPGAAVGGIIVGLTEALAARYLGGEYALLAVFALLITILLLRPSGLFVRAKERTV